jgi:hypothetical protein
MQLSSIDSVFELLIVLLVQANIYVFPLNVTQVQQKEVLITYCEFRDINSKYKPYATFFYRFRIRSDRSRTSEHLRIPTKRHPSVTKTSIHYIL